LHAIFGRAGEDVKNDSLEVPSGVEGIVINTQRFSRQGSLSEEEKKRLAKEIKEVESEMNRQIAEQFRALIHALAEVLEKKELRDTTTNKTLAADKDDKSLVEQAGAFTPDHPRIRSPERRLQCEALFRKHQERIQFLMEEKERRVASLKRGDELPAGVQQMVKVYIATKRQISVGDKMAGRHGNKGVISKILPEEDM